MIAAASGSRGGALVGDRGEPWRTLRAALTDGARFGLVEHLARAGCELVATEALTRADLLPAQAARRGFRRLAR